MRKRNLYLKLLLNTVNKQSSIIIYEKKNFDSKVKCSIQTVRTFFHC